MADVFTAAHFSSGPGDAVGNGPTFISTLAHVDGGAGAFYGITAAPTTEHGCFVDDRSPDRTVPWCRQICGHLCAIHPRRVGGRFVFGRTKLRGSRRFRCSLWVICHLVDDWTAPGRRHSRHHSTHHYQLCIFVYVCQHLVARPSGWIHNRPACLSASIIDLSETRRRPTSPQTRESVHLVRICRRRAPIDCAHHHRCTIARQQHRSRTLTDALMRRPHFPHTLSTSYPQYSWKKAPCVGAVRGLSPKLSTRLPTMWRITCV